MEDRDSWETPHELFIKLDLQYSIEVDCCATEKNSKTNRYYKYFESANKIIDMAWMNPPFSKAYKMFKHFFKVVKKGVAIYRCDNMETKVWQDIIFPNASWIFIPNKRIKYEGQNGKGARFPSALIGFNINKPMNLKGVNLFTNE